MAQAETEALERKAAWPLRAIGWIFKAMSKLCLIALFIAIGLFVGGFLKFSTAIADYPTQTELASADGIVALTGGAQRIEVALGLMAQRRGQRLLISGVHEATSLAALRKQHSKFDSLFDCCVDVEKMALNTVGNARESEKWAQSKGYRSLIVVTSGYHMPRSMLEFRRAMPGIKLIPHPVHSQRFTDKSWWRDAENLRFVMSEYLKYLGAQLRAYIPTANLAALQQVVRWV